MAHLDAQHLKTLARGHCIEILARYAPILTPVLDRAPGHGPCSVCGGNDRCRAFNDVAETGGILCNNCGTFPDIFAVLQWVNGWTFPEALAAVADVLGIVPGDPAVPVQRKFLTTQRHEPTKPEPRKAARLRRLYRGSTPTRAGDLVAKYLDARSLNLAELAPGVLRTISHLDYWQDGANVSQWPAMLARVTGPDGKPVGLHATYLDPQNPGQKAPVPAPRKLWPTHRGATRGAAVRLYPMTGHRLAVAEGIETAMAVHQLAGIPVWSCLNASLLAMVEIPSRIREVIIAADHDANGAGQNAADRLASRLLREGRRVRIALPPVVGQDWNDVLLIECGEVAA